MLNKDMRLKPRYISVDLNIYQNIIHKSINTQAYTGEIIKIHVLEVNSKQKVDLYIPIPFSILPNLWPFGTINKGRFLWFLSSVFYRLESCKWYKTKNKYYANRKTVIKNESRTAKSQYFDNQNAYPRVEWNCRRPSRNSSFSRSYAEMSLSFLLAIFTQC